MNALAMRTGKASPFAGGVIPQGGVDYFTDSGEFRGGRTTDEKTASRAFRLSGSGWFKVKAH
jgi:hypothetical protein